MNKPENFLQFEFVGFGNEIDHLRKASERLNEAQIDQAAQMKLEGKTLREIGKALGISYQKADRLLKARTANA